MFRLSCFADEICHDLDGQTEFLIANRINYIELRSVCAMRMKTIAGRIAGVCELVGGCIN